MNSLSESLLTSSERNDTTKEDIGCVRGDELENGTTTTATETGGQRISLPRTGKKLESKDDDCTAWNESADVSVNSSWSSQGPMTPRIAGYARSVRIDPHHTRRAWFWICLSVRATKYRKVATFWPSRIFETAIGMIVLGNVTLAVWAISVSDDLERNFFDTPIFWACEIVSVVAFLSEYLLRLWSCVEDVKLRERSPCVARMLWAVKPLSLLDLFCLLLVAAGIMDNLVDVDSVTVDRLLLELRVLVLLRFERQLKALGRLKIIIGSEVRELALAGFFTICLTVYCGVIYYFVEKTVDDDMKMGTAIWWGVQTVTSLGYGTVTPQSVVGKVLSGALALVGLIAFAIPAGIISSRFAIIAEEEAMAMRHTPRSSTARNASWRHGDVNTSELLDLRREVKSLRKKVAGLSRTLQEIVRIREREMRKRGE